MSEFVQGTSARPLSRMSVGPTGKEAIYASPSPSINPPHPHRSRGLWVVWEEGGQTVIGQQGECRIRSCRRSPAGFGQVEEYSKPFSFMSNDGGLEGEYTF